MVFVLLMRLHQVCRVWCWVAGHPWGRWYKNCEGTYTRHCSRCLTNGFSPGLPLAAGYVPFEARWLEDEEAAKHLMH